MTVGELIEQLQQFPKDLPMFLVYDTRAGIREITFAAKYVEGVAVFDEDEDMREYLNNCYKQNV